MSNDYPTPTTLPNRNVVFDLDTVERPKDEIVEVPFTANVNGRPITMTDPGELDWQDLMAIDSPPGFLRHCLNEEDRKYLRDQKIPGWKFNLLMDAYADHYNLAERVARAQEAQQRRSQI